MEVRAGGSRLRSRSSRSCPWQRGAALTLFLLAAIAVASGALSIAIMQAFKTDRWATRLTHQALLERSASAIRHWYRSHLADLARRPESLDMQAVLAQANVPTPQGLSAASTALLSDAGIPGHVIVLWIPGPSGQPARLDVITGMVVAPPDCLIERISGIDLQRHALRATSDSMARMARGIERWARGRRHLEIDDIGCNPFRAAPPCQAPGLALPALDHYVDAGQVDWTATGITDAVTKDAWGAPIEVSTLVDSQTSRPPFSLSIRARPPFGGELTLAAIQPL